MAKKPSKPSKPSTPTRADLLRERAACVEKLARARADRTRRCEQLRYVEGEIAKVNDELAALNAKREALTLAALDDPKADADLLALEESVVKATAKNRSLEGKATAARRTIEELDATIRLVEYHALQAVFRQKYAELLALAQDVDADSASPIGKAQRVERGCAELYQLGVTELGYTHLNLLGQSKLMVIGSMLRTLDPDRKIAPQVHRRYLRPLAEQIAEAVPVWLSEDREPPKGWTSPTTQPTDAPPPAAVSAEPEMESTGNAAADTAA
jgi:hypothetical protein